MVEGFLEGSVVHFHLVRTVVVKSTGSISASGLGMPFLIFLSLFVIFSVLVSFHVSVEQENLFVCTWSKRTQFSINYLYTLVVQIQS